MNFIVCFFMSHNDLISIFHVKKSFFLQKKICDSKKNGLWHRNCSFSIKHTKVGFLKRRNLNKHTLINI